MTAGFRPQESACPSRRTCSSPRPTPARAKACQAVRRLPGVVRADALFGTPDVLAIVTGDDLAGMDAVIDRIVELPEVVGTESKVVRWIEAE
jgi:hypothetical protein